MKKLALAAIAATAAATPALACTGIQCPQPTAVPEISAMHGVAAVAALAAVVLLVWERRRRAA